ncbi:hypothetical protein D3C85_1611810 [compost metagenome]
MIGVRGRGGVETQNVPLCVFAAHDVAAQVAAAGPRSAGLHKEHRFDVRLQRIVREALKHGHGRIPPARCAGAVIERQQKTNRRLLAQTLFGLRGHFNRRSNAAQQTDCQGAHR